RCVRECGRSVGRLWLQIPLVDIRFGWRSSQRRVELRSYISFYVAAPMSPTGPSRSAAQVPTLPAIHKTAAFRSAVTVAVLGAALALRVISLNHERLWTDEVFSVTYAVQPIVDLIISVLRFDTHLPVYYLQLHFWGWVSTSTFWFYINSLLWSWLAVVAL